MAKKKIGKKKTAKGEAKGISKNVHLSLQIGMEIGKPVSRQVHASSVKSPPPEPRGKISVKNDADTALETITNMKRSFQ